MFEDIDFSYLEKMFEELRPLAYQVAGYMLYFRLVLGEEKFSLFCSRYDRGMSVSEALDGLLPDV